MGGRRLSGLVDALGRRRLRKARLRTDPAATDGRRLLVQSLRGAWRQQLRPERRCQCRGRRLAVPACTDQLRLRRPDRRRRPRHARVHGAAPDHRPAQQHRAAGNPAGTAARTLCIGHSAPGRRALGHPEPHAGAHRAAHRQPTPAQAEPGAGGVPAPYCSRHAAGAWQGARLRGGATGRRGDRACLAHAARAPEQRTAASAPAGHIR